MSRVADRFTDAVQRFPRVSGDEPDDARLEGAMIAFSPRERG